MVLETEKQRRKTLAMRLVEERHGRPIEEILADLVDRGLTQRQIAAELGYDPSAVSRWFDRLAVSRPGQAS